MNRQITPVGHVGHVIENWIAIIVLLFIAVLLVISNILRNIGSVFFLEPEYVQYLVLWTGFCGAMITTREKKHLSLGIGTRLLGGRQKLKRAAGLLVSFVNVTVLTVLFVSSVACILIGFDLSDKLTNFFPMQLLLIILPVAFFCMLIRFLRREKGNLRNKLLVATGVLVGLFLSFSTILSIYLDLLYWLAPLRAEASWDGIEQMIFSLEDLNSLLVTVLFWPVLVILILAAIFGSPIFIILGAITILLYTGNPLSQLSNISLEAIGALTKEHIAAIPLFSLAGFILSESKAGERLIFLFNRILGWLPGGLAYAAILVCGFFTTFTGATGVTILALGGILVFALKRSRYSHHFSEGLLTGAGSIGLLFFPSLPLIMYGVTALVNVKAMFIGGLIPGLIMILALVVVSVIYISRHKVTTSRFTIKLDRLAVLKLVLECLLPVIVIVGFLSGLTTLIETGALAVVYVIIVEVCLPGDISFRRLPEVILKAVPVLGGILIIMAIAQGLNSYIVDAEIPQHLAEWMKNHIQSPYLFLILLNIALLITGCFMDIFSAILVVAPLVIVLGDVYGINEVHLGIIFLANLQLGYLTPPVGLNLFLASYRFEVSLDRIYKDVLPFFLALLVAVLMITYIPVLTTGLLSVLKF